MTRSPRLWSLLFALATAAACGDNLSPAGGVDAGADAPGAFVEAPHGIPPQLVNDGGSALSAPKIQPIFFAGDDAIRAQIEDFDTQLGSSSYWTAATAEYGVGNVSSMPSIVSSEAVPTTEDGVESFIASHLDGTHTADGWPAVVDPQTIYAFFLPAGAQISGPDGNSCDAYGAYHFEIAAVETGSGSDGSGGGGSGSGIELLSPTIVYALMPRCGQGSDAIDQLTAAYSHELVEAATDPRPITALAWGDADANNYIMAYTPGAEAGDYCEYLESAFFTPFGGYEAQRIWSNAASRAGHDPCVPAPTTLPYVGAVPIFPGTVMITDENNDQIATQGVSVPVGQSVTIPVNLFSDSATAGQFTISADDVNQLFGESPDLKLTLDANMGENGTVAHLTITRLKAGQLPGSELVIAAKTGGVTVGLSWGYVTN